ncbi:MAG: hypothetical protein ACI9FJ_002338 [Alteromonadaceae bacterium]|jgi:hypothetical protein
MFISRLINLPLIPHFTSLAVALLLVPGLLFSPLARAESCNIELQYGILITPEHIRILDRHFTKIQINYDEQLFINGEWIQLEVHEVELLKSFSKGLRSEVPQIVGIAMEGAEIGLTALDKIMNGIANNADGDLFQEEFESFRARFKQKFNQLDDKFYIAPQSLNKLDDFFEDELGQEVKKVVTGSLGAVLITLSEAINSNESGLEREASDVSKQLTRLENKIEQQLSVKSLVLQRKAKQFCDRLTELNKTESELHVMVPKLRAYDVVKLRN